MIVPDLIVAGRNWSRDGVPEPTKEGVCVVLGDAESGLTHIARLHFRKGLYAVNRAGMFRHDVDILVTQAPTSCDPWRWATRGPGPFPIKVVAPEEPADEIVEFNGPHGSSGLYAALVALHHGWERVILCGVDLSHPNYRRFLRPWEFYHDLLEPRVRSISGCTRDLLGSPGTEWYVP